MPPAQGYAMPHAQGHAMPPPGAPRSMKGLAIGLGAGMVAITGVIIALVVARGGGGGGRGSREDLVKAALAAMSAGDIGKLVELSDPVGLHARALDCSERDKDKGGGDPDPDKDGEGDKDAADDTGDVDDPQIEEKRIRRQAEKLVEKTKGMKFELVSIAARPDEDGRPTDGKGLVMKQGDRATKGCVFKVDVAIHDLVAKVRITEASAGEASEQEVKLSAIDAGGSWYLMKAPKVSAGGGSMGGKLRAYKDQMCACKDRACAEKVQEEAKAWGRTVEEEARKLPKDEQQAIDEIDEEMQACERKLREGDAAAEAKAIMAKLEDYKAKMCTCADRACAARVQQDLASWFATASSRMNDMKSSPEDERKAEALMEAYGECAEKLAAGDASAEEDPLPPEEPPPGGGASAGASAGEMSAVPACADYGRQIDKILACPKYPRSAAEAMKKGYEQMAKSWAATAGSPEARESWIKACVAGAEGLKKLVASMCP
jgi:hypothetical protein